MSPEILSFIATYGYFAIFIGCLIEGEALVIIAGFLAFIGQLSLPIILLVAFTGTIISDLSWFLLGRYSGTKFIERWKWLHEISLSSTNLAGKRPRLTAFMIRFLYGLRVIVPFSLGKTKIHTSTFILYNALGVFVWVGIFTSLGYFFAEGIEALLGKTKHLVLIILIVTIILIASFNYLSKFTERYIK